MKSALTLITALGFLSGCSEKPKSDADHAASGSEASGYGTGYNFYQAKTAEDFEAFKAIILGWAQKNGYETANVPGLKISKTHGPKCVTTIWTEGETPGIFKLMWSNEFKGDSPTVAKATEDFNNEGGSLFSVTMQYYVVPK